MDRVVQTAAMLILGPIFEADLPPEQYAYRPDRSALDAIRHVHALLTTGHAQVVDADLSGYFDSIPHGELMKSLARRISDGAMLHLLSLWLKAPVRDGEDREDQHGPRLQRRTNRGTPQGSPISPLLANLYMRRFVLGWRQLGYEDRLRARIVNYADDFVICCQNTGSAAMDTMRRLMARLQLTVNETKTKCVDAWERPFDFLGYQIGPCYSAKTGKRYMGTRPSPKSMRAIRSKIETITRRSSLGTPVAEKVDQLNRLLRGWANYFCLGPVWKAYRSVDGYVSERLRHWLSRQGKERTRRSRTPCDELYEKHGLVRLQALARSHPWAKA
jgi:group II intron reverse transcriptase/maturase